MSKEKTKEEKKDLIVRVLSDYCYLEELYVGGGEGPTMLTFKQEVDKKNTVDNILSKVSDRILKDLESK
jgi:hypothetical protein